MQWLVILLLVLAALATLSVLAMGLFGMLTGRSTPERSQALMQKRVLLQGLAVLLAVLLLVIAGSSGR